MKTRTARVLTLVSLFLWVAVSALWLRSYFHCDYLTRTDAGGTTDLFSEACALQYAHSPNDFTAAPDGRWHYLHFASAFSGELSYRPVWVKTWGRFIWDTGRPARISVPCWVVSLPTGVLPAVWAVRHRRGRWRRYTFSLLFGLWPLELAFAAGGGDMGEAIAFWTGAAVLAVVFLGLRDALISLAARPQMPWPWQWRERRRYHRLRRGQCVECGYDLRASPERCPECGAATPSRERSAAAGFRSPRPAD